MKTGTSADFVLETEFSSLGEAIYQHGATSSEGMLERLFRYFFDQLVYAQIWEDPAVDLDAMAVEPGQHIVAIASGGCNVLSYLTADPGRITAVDLNPAHLALTRLKLAAARRLPSQEDFDRYFRQADTEANIHLYELFIEPYLDGETRKYWSGRNLVGRRRISLFSDNVYKKGLLGRSITVAHFLARIAGTDPSRIMSCKSVEDQRAFFEDQLAPLFQRRSIRMLMASPLALYGFGIPPAQYRSLLGGRHMADVLCQRLEKLACLHPLSDNYFARQAFGRTYAGNDADFGLPPYLQSRSHALLKSRADRVQTVKAPITEALEALGQQSVDRVVLLDAQDWMNDAQLNRLWYAITRAAKPEARVIFRTAAYHSPLEGRLDPQILNRWRYHSEMSAKLTRNDRSAIYGGFHLYCLEN